MVYRCAVTKAQLNVSCDGVLLSLNIRYMSVEYIPLADNIFPQSKWGQVVLTTVQNI